MSDLKRTQLYEAHVAAGATMVIFITGRGTPVAYAAPTFKIATNNAIYEKKTGWMDFNAGTVAEGEPIPEAARRLFDLVLEVAGGKETCSEKHGYREISIFKDGVVL